MNKNLPLIVIALVLLVGIGGAGYMLMQQNASQQSGIVTSPSTSQENVPATSQKTLKDLLASGVAQKCTYSDKMDEVDVQGTSYMMNGKMRGDIDTTVNGKTIMMHMILDGKTMYNWMEDAKTGLMMTVDTDKTEAQISGTAKVSQAPVDINKVIDYKCEPWSADSSMFTPPTAVKFTDYSAMMQGGKTTPGSSMMGTQCAACDSLSGDEKTQCKAALKCN